MRKAAEEAKSDELQAAALAYRQTVLSGVAEVEIALGRLEEQRRNEQFRQQALNELTGVADRMAIRERLGLAIGTESADRAIERDQAALEVIAARGAHDLAYVALYKALGGARLTRDAASDAASDPARVAPAVAEDGSH
jgi:outer membrane protein TolC